jgi:hypothetical protein
MPSSHEPPFGGSGQIRPPLRLVPKNPPPKPRRRRGVARPVEDVFDEAQTAKLRLAITNARTRFSSWQRLADAMGVHVDTLRGAGRYRSLSRCHELKRVRAFVIASLSFAV